MLGINPLKHPGKGIACMTAGLFRARARSIDMSLTVVAMRRHIVREGRRYRGEHMPKAAEA